MENKLSISFFIYFLNRRVIFSSAMVKKKAAQRGSESWKHLQASLLPLVSVCVRLAFDEPALSGAAICWRLRKLTSASDGGFAPLELVSVKAAA